MIFYRIACYLLIITCFLHLFGHVNMAPSNDSEKQVFDMMNTNQLDLGEGKSITMMSLYKGMSLCFSLMFLWSGVLSLYLSYSVKNQGTLKKIAIVNTGALAAGTAISFYYFFFAPTTCFVLSLLFFLAASFKLKEE